MSVRFVNTFPSLDSPLYRSAEEDYLLRDPENEQKYGFKLSEALQRAKASGGKLFAGKAFYVTPKVPTDAKLLKNVVTAGGGQVRLQINQSLLLTS